MLNINLSRLHHLIKNHNDEIFRLINRLNSIKLEYDFNIYLDTRQEDFISFQNKLEARKKGFTELRENLAINLTYVTYLKNILETANEKAGITKLLNENSEISRNIRFLNDFLANLGDNINQDLELIQPVNFYKTTFTDQSKLYTLPIYLFSANDAEQLQTELNEFILRQQQLNDDIASLNQRTKVSIQKFETFKENYTNFSEKS